MMGSIVAVTRRRNIGIIPIYPNMRIASLHLIRVQSSPVQRKAFIQTE